jgi:hypothetical protein
LGGRAVELGKQLGVESVREIVLRVAAAFHQRAQQHDQDEPALRQLAGVV